MGAPWEAGVVWGVLTAAPHGVGVGQLGKARLAEVAAVPLHVLLADAAPCQWVADGARHGAIWVTLTGWKHGRNSIAEGREERTEGPGKGLQWGNCALTQTGFRMGEILTPVAKIVSFAALTVVAFGVVLAVVTDTPTRPSTGTVQLRVEVAGGRVTVAVAS